MSGSRTPIELVEQLKQGRSVFVYSESAFPGGMPDPGIIWPEILCEKFRRDVVAIESKVVFLPPDYYDDTWMCRLGQQNSYLSQFGPTNNHLSQGDSQ